MTDQRSEQSHRPVSVSGDDGDKQPDELKEYHYYIGYMETTAMLTEEMAEKLNAKPVGEKLDEPDITTNAQHRGSVQPAGETKARTPRNKRQ